MNSLEAMSCLITLFITINAYAADSTCIATQDDVYPFVRLGINTAIRFKKAEESVDPDGEIYPIMISEQKCDTSIERQVAELPYLGDPGKVENAFLKDADFDGISELFVIHRATLYSDTGTSYGSDYFTTLVYRPRSAEKYELDERISNYFGSGADVLSSPISDDLIYKHPYKSKAQVESELDSARYRAWLEQKRVVTRITRKTYLYDQANTADKTTSYLVAGDQIQVLDWQAGWLKIVFHNKKSDIKGWVLCQDTLECSDQNRSLKR